MPNDKFIAKLISYCGNNERRYFTRKYVYRVRYFFTSNTETELLIDRIALDKYCLISTKEWDW